MTTVSVSSEVFSFSFNFTKTLCKRKLWGAKIDTSAFIKFDKLKFTRKKVYGSLYNKCGLSNHGIGYNILLKQQKTRKKKEKKEEKKRKEKKKKKKIQFFVPD